ncbi:MAG: hypothetical protein J6Y57_04970, partial [Lachnospiraceae bacterium]|nr:hypothetical protein [Lachnospiraceae bacterium]
CILYTGNGDSDPIKKFIADHHYESRFIYEHERQDFEQLLSHCVFFLNTYPAAGGLMAQYAVAHGRLPVTFTDSVTDTTDLFLDREKAGRFVFTDVESVCRYTDRLLDDDAFLKEEESYLEDLIISEEDFSGQLRSIMRNKPGRIRFSYSPEEVRDTAEQGKLAYQLSESELHKLLFASDKTRLLFPVRYIRYLIEQSQQKE